MAKAKLVLGKSEKVQDLLALLKKLKEAGFESVEIETPETIRKVTRYVSHPSWIHWHTPVKYSSDYTVVSTGQNTAPDFTVYCTADTSKAIGVSELAENVNFANNLLS